MPLETASDYQNLPPTSGHGLYDIFAPLAQAAVEAESAQQSEGDIEESSASADEARPQPMAPHGPQRANTEDTLESLDFDFGLDAPGLAGSGFISNSDLLIWIKTHSIDLNDQLRSLMNGAEERTKIVEDLTEIKGMLDVNAPETTKAAAEAMLAAYEGTPYEAELEELLNPLIASLENRIDNHDSEMTDDLVSKYTGTLQEQIDAYAKQDQIDMIQIQDLTSRIREGIQLVSNIISSCNQTSMAIVGNVGR